MNRKTYERIQRRMFEELQDDIDAARKRRYCSEDEIRVAEHALTPAGFRRMQPILDEVGVTGPEVTAWALAHPDEITVDHAKKHDVRVALFRDEMNARLSKDDPASCKSSAPRCEKAYLRFLAFTLEALDPTARKEKREELDRAMGNFLNACNSGTMAADFTCVLEAADASAFEKCTFFRGLPVGWFRPG